MPGARCGSSLDVIGNTAECVIEDIAMIALRNPIVNHGRERPNPRQTPRRAGPSRGQPGIDRGSWVGAAADRSGPYQEDDLDRHDQIRAARGDRD